MNSTYVYTDMKMQSLMCLHDKKQMTNSMSQLLEQISGKKTTTGKMGRGKGEVQSLKDTCGLEQSWEVQVAQQLCSPVSLFLCFTCLPTQFSSIVHLALFTYPKRVFPGVRLQIALNSCIYSFLCYIVLLLPITGLYFSKLKL